MRKRVTFPALFALPTLLAWWPAGAGSAPISYPTAVPAERPVMAMAVTTPEVGSSSSEFLCSLNRTTPAELVGSNQELVGLTPKPQQQSDYNYCGMCGADPCRGVLRGTICGIDYANNRYKRCEMLYGDECPGEQKVICYCYSEDIP
jgi:hypothetical protein